MNPHLVEVKLSPREEIEAVQTGLFKVPEIAIEDRSLTDFRGADGEKRLITAEVTREVNEPDQDDSA